MIVSMILPSTRASFASVALSFGVAVTGCQAESPDVGQTGESTTTPAASAEPWTESGMAPYAPGGLPDLGDRASSHPIPASFALGRDATAAEISELDIDVLPDGRGLPEGSGSVAEGAELYQVRCAACHGFQGEGTPLAGPLYTDDAEMGFRRRVVGHFWPHATTAFDYVRRAMPWDTPGTLTNDEVYAVVAYILAQSGVIADDAVLDAASLAAVEMPAADRFVRDNRPSSTRVR